jgi:peptide/nickel transport system permease protein
VIYYALRRLAVLAILLVGVSFAAFSLLALAPGDPVGILLGDAPRTPATVRALRHEYHLDKPFLTQYWLWARQAVQLNFGRSVQTSLPVRDSITARLPTSLFLGGYAFILTLVFGVGLGTVAALRRQTATDRVIVGGASIGLSTPAFVSGVFLVYVFAIVLHWFPVFGKGSGFLDELQHLTLPACSLALIASAYVLKHTRAALFAVVDQDYVTFARARGLPYRRILFVYILRNALIPVVTISGLMLAFLITGAVLVEVTFNLPGIGQLLVQSATTKDLPMIQGVTIVVAAVIMLSNLLADIAYEAVDPRIHLGRRSK